MLDVSVASETLVDLLRNRALRQPDQPAYTFLLEDGGEVSLTYAELDRRARDLGARLQSAAAPGERAVLLYPPGIEYIVAFFTQSKIKIMKQPPHLVMRGFPRGERGKRG